MRRLLILILLLSGSAAAQPAFQLTDPMVLVDGERVTTVGAPLAQESFGALVLDVPAWGAVRISDAPFPGARRGGDFSGARLAVLIDGRSLRLRSGVPLFPTRGDAPAYVRLDREAVREAPGPVEIRLAGVPAAPSVASLEPPAAPASPPPDPPVVAEGTPPAPPASPPPPEPEPPENREDLDALRAQRDALRVSLRRLQTERDDAILRLEALRAEVERLQMELAADEEPPALRQALQEEIQRLRAEVEALRAASASHPSPPAGSEPAEPAVERVALPGFDRTRLLNADALQRQLDAIVYPAWAEASGLGGDVLVLFQTDARGVVVRTAVPRPIGGGLDALAEEIVQAMRFRPVRTGGQATGLRSQIIVRFTP